jgi:hypothetical protein
MTDKEIALAAVQSLGRADATSLATQIEAGELTDTEIIDREQAVPAFDNTKDYSTYPVGFAVQDEGQVWELLQPYNAAEHPNQRPSSIRALWGLKHTKNPLKAKPFVEPLGTSGMYMKDECVLENGLVYISKVDNNVYSPSAYPQNWTLYTGETEEPTEPVEPEPTPEPEPEPEDPTYPEFVQPTGAHDAYKKGDRVTYNGKVYESLIDANVYSPDTYPAGWREVSE